MEEDPNEETLDQIKDQSELDSKIDAILNMKNQPAPSQNPMAK